MLEVKKNLGKQKTSRENKNLVKQVGKTKKLEVKKSSTKKRL